VAIGRRLRGHVKYLKIKNKMNKKLFKYYNKEFIRKLKLRLFINTQRSESNLINNIKKTYGDDLVLIIGDGNVNPSMKYIISTPNKGLKKLLSKNFEIYHMDEFRTSCLDYRTTDKNLIKNINCKVIDKNNKYKKLHSVLVSRRAKLKQPKLKAVSKILNKKTGQEIYNF